MRVTEQLALAAEFATTWLQPHGLRYDSANDQYGPADAAVLRSMLLRICPKQFIEVGSGHSTSVVLDTCETSDLDVRLTCVEPYPDRLLSRLRPGDAGRLEILRVGAQDLPIEHYTALQAGDVLFIDSTHVVKAGSDVVWLFLHVLPRLAPGVIVHIHDIFWPFEYPQTWLEQRRDWTELYLLRAMLTGSKMWQIDFFSSWLWMEHPEIVPAQLRTQEPGSIWLRKTS